MASTLAVGGVVTANAGVVVDNFTLDGTTLALSSGNMALDSAGHILLDADSGEIAFQDSGTTFLEIANSSSDAIIRPTVQDKDILFNGNDGGAAITALTLDMSDAGSAYFNNKVGIGTSSVSQRLDVQTSTVNTGMLVYNTNTASGASVPLFLASESDGSTTNVSFENTGAGNMVFRTGATTKAGYGTERLRIDSLGLVGIGTTAPNAPLTIQTESGTGSKAGLRLNNPFGFADLNTGAEIIFSQDRSSAEDYKMAAIISGTR
jgi:hypothetical protein